MSWPAFAYQIKIVLQVILWLELSHQVRVSNVHAPGSASCIDGHECVIRKLCFSQCGDVVRCYDSDVYSRQNFPHHGKCCDMISQLHALSEMQVLGTGCGFCVFGGSLVATKNKVDMLQIICNTSAACCTLIAA